jgi:soluble lytic murein transglycosylase-like protein
MRRLSLSVALLAALAGTAVAAPRNEAYDALILRFAKMHGVPESLVHRIILRESRYNPKLTNRHRYFGLMQISYATARSMGYTGTPEGLLDPAVNLTYAVPYLANAYRAAGGSETRAVALYAGGYYFVARQNHMLGELRTAATTPLGEPKPAEPAPEASAPEPSTNPLARLVQFLSVGPARAAAAADAAPN